MEKIDLTVSDEKELVRQVVNDSSLYMLFLKDKSGLISVLRELFLFNEEQAAYMSHAAEFLEMSPPEGVLH